MKTLQTASALIGTLLLGAAIGASMGIIFAPAKGKDTMNKVLKGVKTLTKEQKGKLRDHVDSALS